MSFRIEYIGPTDQQHIALGRIQIGDFSEHFRMDMSYWDRTMYETQWKSGVTRLREGVKTSCVIQSLANPETANFFFWWPMYVLEGGIVAVQNCVLFAEELSETFDPTDPYRFIGPRETVTEDGNRISEWTTTLAELAKFERELIITVP